MFLASMEDAKNDDVVDLRRAIAGLALGNVVQRNIDSQRGSSRSFWATSLQNLTVAPNPTPLMNDFRDMLFEPTLSLQKEQDGGEQGRHRGLVAFDVELQPVEQIIQGSGRSRTGCKAGSDKAPVSRQSAITAWKKYAKRDVQIVSPEPFPMPGTCQQILQPFSGDGKAPFTGSIAKCRLNYPWASATGALKSLDTEPRQSQPVE